MQFVDEAPDRHVGSTCRNVRKHTWKQPMVATKSTIDIDSNWNINQRSSKWDLQIQISSMIPKYDTNSNSYLKCSNFNSKFDGILHCPSPLSALYGS